jgi:hypothetical protein
MHTEHLHTSVGTYVIEKQVLIERSPFFRCFFDSVAHGFKEDTVYELTAGESAAGVGDALQYLMHSPSVSMSATALISLLKWDVVLIPFTITNYDDISLSIIFSHRIQDLLTSQSVYILMQYIYDHMGYIIEYDIEERPYMSFINRKR